MKQNNIKLLIILVISSSLFISCASVPRYSYQPIEVPDDIAVIHFYRPSNLMFDATGVVLSKGNPEEVVTILKGNTTFSIIAEPDTTYYLQSAYQGWGPTPRNPIQMAIRGGGEYFVRIGFNLQISGVVVDHELGIKESSRTNTIKEMIPIAQQIATYIEKTQESSSSVKIVKEEVDLETNIEIQSIEPPPISKESIDAFGKYYALVIGNNNYNTIPDLKTAVTDANMIAEILQNDYMFDVNLLIDATRTDILLAFNDYRKTLSINDNLLIYYAGHGWLDEEADEGYWLPVDAESDNSINWISNNTITSDLRAMQAKHVMIISDSCYSGKLTRGLSIINRTPDYLTRMATKRTRVVMSSGGLEPVMDSSYNSINSVFATSFINILNENKTVLDATTMFSQIRHSVMLNSDQTPEYGDIRKAGHDGGDFIFIPVSAIE